jgi:hypothetical protein
MADLSISPEDEAAIRAVLVRWRDEGHPNPLLPTDFDHDSDEVVSSYGLDGNDDVTIVSGVKIQDTVSLSDGDDVGPQQDVEVGEPRPDDLPT